MGIKVIQLTSKFHHENLLASLHQMRMQGQLCDITVQVDYQGDVEEFQAHQLILAASSGYFQKILLAQDANQDKIQLSNMHSTDFSKYLEFVYTGKIEVARNKIGDVQEVARLLDCEGLSVVCGDALSAGVLERPERKTCGSEGGGELPAAQKEEEKVKAKEQHLKRQLSPQEIQDLKKKLKAKTLQRKTTKTMRKLKLRLGGRKVPLRRLHVSTKDDSQDKNQAKESRGKEESERENKDVENEVQEHDQGLASDGVHDSDFGEDPPNDDDDDQGELLTEEEDDDDEGNGKRLSKAQFSCNKCQRTFHYEKSYLKHISTYHGVKAHIIHRCETCSQTFANSSNLKIHEKHVHSNERLFSCDSCTKTFKRKKDVVRHKRQVHERNMRHVCSECGKSLSSKTALLLHERTHTGLKPYECTVCKAKFTQKSALNLHQRTHTGEKPFACDQCDAKFSQKHMLAYHKRSHTGERPFMCESCGKSFASKEYLRHHSNIHTGSRPYKCDHCGRGFAQRNSLNQHLKIHTGERPYSCKDCDKHFTQLNALQRHQRIHTGEKPYMCGLCKRTFTDKSTLRRHTTIHGSDTPWKSYLVVLEGNMEEKKSPMKEKTENGGTEEKKSKANKGASSAVAVVPNPNDANKTNTEPVVLAPEQVTLPADWATHGTIALVSHGGVGAITVIHTEVPPGTQIQPIVATRSSGAISLEGSAIAVPFSIPVSVAQVLSSEAPSSSLSVPVSETLLASVSGLPTVPATSLQAVLDPASEQKPTSEEDTSHPDIQTVIVGEVHGGKKKTDVENGGQNETTDEAETTKDQNLV
ncbi:GDNF-inducible zinc finger protein 1 [Cyprinodon tularosa]|uniref:GDNF-inducible zinc finger protein 1 n=1 Tax=Cyprinodon tularosa TaxID=77115 RepID=UPI0018E21F84|nr:GDNF-inducible zinc finger protein 1 [Cyprinodon tularosa]XP_038141977.1 GDNF-inducible zinc finger protein 1 [Cyprinodon tularosa]XP_038141978.1 GDNF-inducible zinc finger protein 1 [Cyprinodon tularosa]